MNPTLELAVAEQQAVRTALRFLRARCGTWTLVAHALHFKTKTISNVLAGRRVSATVAFRVARMLGITVDALLAGQYPPPGTCPHCGHHTEEEARLDAPATLRQPRGDR